MDILSSVDHNKAFYLTNGTHVHDLMQLADEVHHMDQSTFASHVNGQKHDFANWVNEVFEQPDLAKKLSSATTPHNVEIILLRAIIKALRH